MTTREQTDSMSSKGNLSLVYCLQGNMIGRKDSNGPQGNGVNEDISFTLNATDRHAIVEIDEGKDEIPGFGKSSQR